MTRTLFWGTSLYRSADNNVLAEMHHVGVLVTAAPSSCWLPALLSPGCSTSADPAIPARLAAQHEPLYQFLLNKWYFDELYDSLFVRPALWLGRFLWKRATAG